MITSISLFYLLVHNFFYRDCLPDLGRYPLKLANTKRRERKETMPIYMSL